ncbi:DNA-binding protein, partial [Escherichia coli]|nr:DNA-binding protein [Escherichia coli]EIZ7736063.1 DNA-binding protein [Escherichia coli]HEG7715222.1 DNA-binding protein [Escherichia coli]
GRVDYPDVFERVWREYPHRAGSNPKKSAFNAWRARLREGVSPDVVLDGVRRYARYLEATGKAGTEFVQQASTFFGPNRNFENPWSLPKAGAVSLRCVNHISEPDTEIPPGFRG